ncbi:MAG: hydroxyacylglutathione hydrolase [Thermodesulfobacteriota bacterium]|jgi:hydroxyacylglutathione hydrolase
MRVIPIPVLKDNYAYLVIDDATKDAAVVDPSEAKPVAAAVKREGVNFTAIINTHHHWDHVGGNEELVREFPHLKVYGHKRDRDRTPCITNLVDEGDTVRIGTLEGRFLFIPCHTSGHVAVYFPAEKAVFTGDTLFVAGCGRLFEGTAADMYNNMVKLMALPDDTRVYCGHEYTEKNLQFALTLEPSNAKVKEKLRWARAMREQQRPTVPSTVAEEKAINPFVRVNSTELQATLRKQFPSLSLDPVSVLEKTRFLKDQF